MQFEFKYGPGKLSFEVPAQNLLYVAVPTELPELALPQAAVAEALAHPVGSPPLYQLVQKGQRVLLICDDLTRPTPQSKIVPLLLDELNRGGVPDADIEILIALGTHRPMTDEEIMERFGPAVLGRVRITNHDYLDPASHVDLGLTSRGFPVEVNRKVVEMDVKVSVSTVLPHPLAGWSGGAKILLPGVASASSTASTHYLGGIHGDPLELCGNVNNMVRQQIEEAGGRIGLDFTVNVITDEHGRMVGCIAGHHLAAHRAAVTLAEKVYRPNIPALADVVICNAYPADRDFWQGFKPFVYSHLGVRPGGVILLCIYAEEGLSGDAPEHEETTRLWTAKPPEETLRALEAGLIQDRIAGAICVAHAKLLRRADVLCISEGMNADAVRSLGFRPVASPAAGLEEAFQKLGPAARVGVIPFAGETLVRLSNLAS